MRVILANEKRQDHTDPALRDYPGSSTPTTYGRVSLYYATRDVMGHQSHGVESYQLPSSFFFRASSSLCFFCSLIMAAF